VSTLSPDGEVTSVAGAIISLAKSLGLKTTAEGVETQAQFDTLVKLGCVEFQGFLLARPMPAEVIAAARDARQALANAAKVSARQRR
jgi:EAL domain-containing protein (putative c-di-GMP-specific phosphodiesterase class I)